MDKKKLLRRLEKMKSLCQFIESHTPEEIIKIISNAFGINPQELAKYPMGGYSRVSNNDGSFSKGNGCYIYVLYDLKQHLDEYVNFYARLSDDISRKVFMYQMRYRLIPDIDFIHSAYALSAKYSQYFAEDIFELFDNEIFVDCGGFTGDTATEFLKRCKNYRRVYIYEPLRENIINCRKNLSGFDNIVIRQAGVGSKSSEMQFDGGGSSGSFAVSGQSRNQNSNVDTFEIISLDEEIKEPVTFIKMDVECFEPEAIRGAAGHIKNDSPKLAICLYHMVSDLWEIPKLINEISPCYDYYLRHYDSNQNWEYVLYAIPSNQRNKEEARSCESIASHKSEYSQTLYDFLSETEPFLEQVDSLPFETAAELYAMFGTAAKSATLNISQIDPELRVALCDKQDKVLERIVDMNPSFVSADIHGIYTPAVQGYRRWGNVELLKDKCLTGYMLANELGARPVMMFGTKPADYPYTELLPQLEIMYTDAESGVPNVYFEHLSKEYHRVDALILHGMYDQTVGYLDAYRNLRPDGKVYCGLDMNSYWMANINWSSLAARRFSEQCDVIATSCRSLRDALNRNPNVHFSCHWIPNGFFNPSNITVTADAESKKNIILTVGRIGTAQKNNGELLLAFAKAHKTLKGWKLRLVGSIEPEFKSFITQYFEKFPHLKDRVIFTGAVTDKNELYREYAQAKLFALTSQLEGGTPNVYAEALVHGCMFVTSDIDAADDITNFGELGLTYKRGDVDGLANTLVKLASNANNDAFRKHIPKALDYAHKHYNWHRNAKKIAYMLYN